MRNARVLAGAGTLNRKEPGNQVIEGEPVVSKEKDDGGREDKSGGRRENKGHSRFLPNPHRIKVENCG